jgi:hypothetical protein
LRIRAPLLLRFHASKRKLHFGLVFGGKLSGRIHAIFRENGLAGDRRDAPFTTVVR